MIEIAPVLEALASLLVLAGAFFTLAGSIGLAGFPDFFLRLHGPTKATTLAVGSLLLASALNFSSRGEQIRFPEALIMLFLFITARQRPSHGEGGAPPAGRLPTWPAQEAARWSGLDPRRLGCEQGPGGRRPTRALRN